jgi:SOS-response transcriptional repressor LexA
MFLAICFNAVMDISEIWLKNFKAVIAEEIRDAGGKAADGYRAAEQRTGLGYDYIYQMYTGKSGKRPTFEVMKKVAEIYADGRGPEWINIENHHGLSKARAPYTIQRIPNQIDNLGNKRSLSGEIPVISWVRAGAWSEAADVFEPGDAEGYLPIFRGHSASTDALKVRGDSMTATHGKSYPQGSYIIVDPAKLSPNNGDRIIAKLEGCNEVTFKVYKDEDGRKWLSPLNQTYPPIMDRFKVLGTVIGKWQDE